MKSPDPAGGVGERIYDAGVHGAGGGLQIGAGDLDALVFFALKRRGQTPNGAVALASDGVDDSGNRLDRRQPLTENSLGGVEE